MNRFVVVLVVCCICSAMSTEARAELRTVRYESWDDCLELSNATARLVIAPASGGRIVHYSRDGGPNFFLGGCQIDVGPELEYPPRHQALWAGPYEAEKLGPLSVRLTSAKDEATGLQMVKVVELAATGARVTLRQTMKNVASKDIAYCLWDRTMTGASYGFFELNPKSRFPARWSMRRGRHGTYRYDGKSPGSPRVEIVDGLLVTVPGKKMEKVAADNVAGWIAGFSEEWLYVKRFPVFADGDYADGGNSVEIWVDAAGTRTEIEPLSPKVQLRPGESYTFAEDWDLRQVREEIKRAEDIPKLLPYVREMAGLQGEEGQQPEERVTVGLPKQSFVADSFARTSLERTRFLLLDSRVVETAENVKLALGKTRKSAHNPLMAEDKPWEQRFDNLYANVIYDEESGSYKCWYSPFIVDNSADGMTLEQRRQTRYRPPDNREMAICYAVSKDGIHWEKPELGLVEFNGSTRNNILWRGPHGAGVFKDLRDPDPARRYKMLFKGNRISVAFSADGIHWGEAISCPEADVAGNTHNNAFWAPNLGKYVGITRTWGNEHGRQVARTESDDFLKWTKAKVVLEGLDKGHQTYAMPVFFHGGVYLGLVAIFDPKEDRVWAELAWSPDTVRWHRICPGTPLIANSEKELAYDWGCVYAGAYPVFLKDEIRIYYGGSDWHHGNWRNAYLCMATLRPDGFAGYEPIDSENVARITTTPIVWTGGAIRISADVSKGGAVTVTVLDEQKRKLAEAEPITETVSDGSVRWKEGFSLETLKGNEIRLRFELRDSKLYSFSCCQ